MRQAEKARIGSVLKAMHQIKQRKKRRRIIIGIGLLLSLAGLLVGCNTVERAQAGMIESLEVEIRPNDSKLFVYRMEDPTGARAHEAQVQRMRAQRRGGQVTGPRDRGGVRSYRLLRTNTQDRKSTRLNSSHVANSYAVSCYKNKNSYTDWVESVC